MLFDMLPLIAVGFGLGLMHALDADHVMAVSALNADGPNLKRTLLSSINWAVGHSGVLLVSGALLFGLGVTLPESLQKVAEQLVGVLLIVLGLYCFWQLRQEKIKFKPHRHGDVVHVHLHEHGHEKLAAKDGHKPVMVGMLHGLAGSAPALALIPAVAQGQFIVAISYLLIFSFGVVLSMLFFCLGLGYVQAFLQQKYFSLFQWSRRLIAAASVAIGSYWLVQAL